MRKYWTNQNLIVDPNRNNIYILCTSKFVGVPGSCVCLYTMLIQQLYPDMVWGDSCK